MGRLDPQPLSKQYTGWMTDVAPTGRPKSVRTRLCNWTILCRFVPLTTACQIFFSFSTFNCLSEKSNKVVTIDFSIKCDMSSTTIFTNNLTIANTGFYRFCHKSKIEKVPKGIQGEMSSKEMASSRNLVSTFGAKASPKGGRNQVPGSVPCCHAAPVSNAPWKPLIIRWRSSPVSSSWY